MAHEPRLGSSIGNGVLKDDRKTGQPSYNSQETEVENSCDVLYLPERLTWLSETNVTSQWYKIADIGTGNSTKHREHISNVREHNTYKTCGKLEADSDSYVILSGNLLLSSEHIDSDTSEWEVVSSNITNHDSTNKEGSNGHGPINLQLWAEWSTLKDNRWGAIESGEVTEERHADVAGNHNKNCTLDNFHQSIFGRSDEFRINWEHITLIGKCEEDDTSCGECIETEAHNIGSKFAIGPVFVVIGNVNVTVEWELEHDDQDHEYQTRK